MKQKIPFKIASINTDSGGENSKHLGGQLQEDEVIHSNKLDKFF